ncbi:unnamed protein product [Heterobilharzia americana]|nr:unnamed protein product [Heterobilharzia americana]
MQEDGNMKVNNLIAPKIAVNRETYQWDEPPNPTLLNYSKYLRQIRKTHDSFNQGNREFVENFPCNERTGDMVKLIPSCNVSTKTKGNISSSLTTSNTLKKESPPTVSSLDDDELAEVQKNLDNFQLLLSQFINTPKLGDNNIGNSKFICNETTENANPQHEEKEDGNSVKEKKEHPPFQKLPNYITFSVKKSHQFAVRRWLHSNYNHI